MPTLVIMSDQQEIGAGKSFSALPRQEGDTNVRSFQATVEGVGTVTATVTVEGSNNGRAWLTCLQFSLSGNNQVTDGGVINSPWAFFRANVTEISGNGARVEVVEGV